jgi:WD40 repeat protein
MNSKNLNIFKEFFNSSKHLLEKEYKNWSKEKLLFQLGYEHAEDSPITRQAEEYLKDGRVNWPWLKQLNRKQKYEPNPNYMTLVGHTDIINGVKLLDNERALSYSRDSTLRLWNLKDGSSKVLEMPLSWSMHGTLPVWSLEDWVQLLDNDRALSWSMGGTLRVWNLEDGSSKVFEEHESGVLGVQLLDNDRALSWSNCGTLRVWNLEDGSSKVFEGFESGVLGVQLLGALRLWNIKDGSSIFLEWTSINMVANGAGSNISRDFFQLLDNERVLTWDDRRPTLHLWNIKDGSSKVLRGHTSSILGVQLLDNNRVLSYSRDCTLRLWNLKEGSSEELKGHEGTVNGVKLLDNDRALSYSRDCTLRLWDLKDFSSKVFKGHKHGILGIHLLDNDRVLSYSWDCTLRLWNLKEGSSEASMVRPSSSYFFNRHVVNNLKLMGSERVLTWSRDATLRLWDIKDGSSILLKGHSWSNSPGYGRCGVIGVQLLDNDRVLSYSDDGTLRLWNLKDGSSKVFDGHTASINGVRYAFSNEGAYCICKVLDNEREWSFSTKLFHPKLSLHMQKLNNDRALSLSDDSTMLLWCLSTQKLLNIYVFEGIEKVFDIGNNRLLCFASNGQHRFLEIMDNEIKQTSNGETKNS